MQDVDGAHSSTSHLVLRPQRMTPKTSMHVTYLEQQTICPPNKADSSPPIVDAVDHSDAKLGCAKYSCLRYLPPNAFSPPSLIASTKTKSTGQIM